MRTTQPVPIRICLLALLPAALIIGCSPVGKLTSQITETAAFANIANLSSACSIYLAEHDGQAPRQLSDLKGMLDDSVTAAGSKDKPLQGYCFKILPGRQRHEYAIVASPVAQGVAGAQTFLATDNGAVYSKDLKGQELSAAPADPLTDGWTKRRGAARVIGEGTMNPDGGSPPR